MKELKCPKCGNVFQVDEADYASIVSQVKNAEFNTEVERRLAELSQRHKAEQELATAKNEQLYQSKLSKKELEIGAKDAEIERLKSEKENEAPTKLQVSVSVKSDDMQKIQERFDNHMKQVDAKIQKHIQEVNQMFADERKRVRERYKEYDGCYLGHYAQWFFWLFFSFGLIVFGFVVIMSLNSYYHWF